MPVYDMVVANSGVKILPFDGSHFPTVPPNRGGSMIIGALTMEGLARRITIAAGRLVIDKTNLPGRYAMTLTFRSMSLRTADIGADAPVPDLFTAIQEQLGLKLQPNRNDVIVLIVDHADRTPSEN